MGNTIQIKRGAGAPANGVLAEGELGFDVANNQLYIGGIGDNAAPILLSGTEDSITVDSSLSDSSTNPVQNKVIKQAFNRVASLYPSGRDITAGVDLNTIDYLRVGNYYCKQNKVAETLINCPTDLAFLMQVYSPISSDLSDKIEERGTWVYRLRKIITHKGDEFYQAINSGSTAGSFTYGPWKRLAKSEDSGRVSVLEYKTSSNSYTDAFKTALENNRRVFVPGGTYDLNDTLAIRNNCELELAQDAVLNFKQTDKNCIVLHRLASLKGNHATIFVPYAFTKNVIHASTEDDYNSTVDANGDGLKNAEFTSTVPPFLKWDPQWKMSRYVTDINICKRMEQQYNEFHYSADGTTCGRGLNIECHPMVEQYWGTNANGDPELKINNVTNFMWGVTMSGVRIAGAFDYGIYIYNEMDKKVTGLDGKTYSFDSWNHEMRIEAVVECTKIGMWVENCNNAHLAVTFQPKEAKNGALYATQGIVLKKCRNINLSSSYVWDWYGEKVKDYGTEAGKENKHLVLYGACPGLILSDANYKYSNTFEIRDTFYTDTPDNLKQMTILQEPFTRWFKPKQEESGLVPYFFDGNRDQKLAYQAEIDDYFDTQSIRAFTDVLASSTDATGAVLNDKGYIPGRIYLGTGETVNRDDALTYYRTTGFIACKQNDVLNCVGLGFSSGDANCGISIFNSAREVLTSLNKNQITSNPSWGISDYTTSEDGFSLKIKIANAAYVRFVFHVNNVGVAPAIAKNETPTYEIHGTLSTNIKVTDNNIASETLNRLSTYINDNLDDHINGLIDAKINNIPLASSETEGF